MTPDLSSKCRSMAPQRWSSTPSTSPCVAAWLGLRGPFARSEKIWLTPADVSRECGWPHRGRPARDWVSAIVDASDGLRGLQADVEFRPAFDESLLDGALGVDSAMFSPGDERVHECVDVGGADHSLGIEHFDHPDDRVCGDWAPFGPAAPLAQSVREVIEAVDVLGAEGCSSLALDVFEMRSQHAYLDICVSEQLRVGEGRRLDVLLSRLRCGEFLAGLLYLLPCSPPLEALDPPKLRTGRPIAAGVGVGWGSLRVVLPVRGRGVG